MKKFTLDEAKEAAVKLGIDFSISGYTPEEFLEGMNIELEHGFIDSETNVTNDDLIVTAKIALAHLKETPLYYNPDVGLEVWEEAIEKLKGDTKGRKIQII